MMLTYEFECDKCEFVFDKKRDREKISGYKPTCPVCKSRKTYQLLSFRGVIRQQPTTLGWLAERNAAEMSPELLAKKRADFKDNGRKAKRVLLEESGKIPKGMKLPGDIDHDPWYGELPKDIKREINKPELTTQDKASKAKKVDNYIMEGK